MNAARRTASALLVLTFCLPAPARANGESAALRARAASQLYNLDRDLAIATFRQAVAADPQDPAAHRGLAIALWMNISFYRGNMTVDDYLGGTSRPTAGARPAPPDAAAAFHEALNQALALARKAVAANPMNAEAHYQVGSAMGLRASYIATVEGSASRAFGAAREAYNAHEKVLELDKGRRDAGLIVGTYRYVVSTLTLAKRLVAYMAGFGGDKALGIRMVEEAAAHGGENQEDARFALVLMYNREKQYDQALEQLALLRGRYPRNRLAWLESGSTALRAGRPADAERFLNDGLARFADDRRERMFGEEALWFYKRGAARAGLGRREEAEQDLRKSVSSDGRKWVHGRAHLELGKLMLRAGGSASQAAARAALQTAAALGDADNDRASATEARRLLATIRT